MAKKKSKDIKEKIVEAALTLAAKQGWENVTLAAIAKKSGVSSAALAGHFQDKTDILVFFGNMMDKRILENDDPEIPVKERLFDILMEHFDILNEYREGLVSVLGSFKSDPKQMVIGLPHVCRSMNRRLEAAGVDTAGVAGALRVAGLMCVYLHALKAWKDDKSPDMAKTMAALDKGLSRAEQLANMFNI